MQLSQAKNFIIPLPDLICRKMAMGIYYDMQERFRFRFTRWFGHVFEAYVGQILAHSLTGGILISEETVRKTYPSTGGRRIADWIIRVGDTLVLIECKATRFYRDTLETCQKEAIGANLRMTRSGLGQLYKFREAILARAPGLEEFYGCSEIMSLLITLEPLYFLNSPLGSDLLNELIAADVDSDFPELDEQEIAGMPVDFPWLILDIQFLEKLQPHLAGGFSLIRALKMLHNSNHETAFGQILAITGLTFKNSFMAKKYDELMEGLGLVENNSSPLPNVI